MAFINYIRTKVYALITAVLLLFGAFQMYRADRVLKKNEELERDVETLEIKIEADAVRSRPVPDDKSDILGRM